MKTDGEKVRSAGLAEIALIFALFPPPRIETPADTVNRYRFRSRRNRAAKV
jgi:hypothetical protein